MKNKISRCYSLVVDSQGNYFIKSRSDEEPTRNRFGIYGSKFEDEFGNVTHYPPVCDETKMLIRVADWLEE